MALAPALAPTLGGALLAQLGWPSIFLALAAYGLLVTGLIAWGMPEPLPRAYRQPLRPGHLLRNYRTLVIDVRFLGYTLTNAAIYGGLFAFLSGSSFVLIDFLGVEPQHFGLYFACMVVGYILGNLASARLSRQLLADQILVRGLLVAVTGGGAMAILAYQGVHTVWAVILPQTLFMIGAGMLLPQALAGALANFPTMAGSASALFGFIQMAVAAGAGALVGRLHDGTPLVMASIIAACAAIALAFHMLLVQRRPARGFEPRRAPGQSPL